MAETMAVCPRDPSPKEPTQTEQVSDAPTEDPERARRVQEARRRNDKFWRDVFAETGVRRYRNNVEENVWKQRLTIAAVAFVIIAGITQAIYRAYLDLNFGFRNIDVTDTERLKEVMFGGSPWIVLCRWPENKKWKVPEILDNHRQELMKFGNLGSVDCSASLPSGAKFSERFRIPSSTEAMVITNGKAPRILNVWALKNWENLSSFLQKNTKVEVRNVEENISFTKNCLFPPGSRCIMFARKGGFTPETKNKVIAGSVGKKGKTRKLKVITVDTGKYEVTGIDLGAKSFYATKVACVGNISPPPTPEAKKKKDVSKDTFIYSVYEGEFTNSRALLEFAEVCISSKEGHEGFRHLAKAPVLRRNSLANAGSSAGKKKQKSQ
ncbi:putative transmembrane protein [Toxoplasma gondii TgCatPRC2]|uniref:Putative transmembrane protein n=2 Tax=Toxoplasma gondii TaxID=5811 RepID=A0A151HJ10_TOXGO|nr:putative transmembrane protein [Toxoplasma gondii TgCatPRC2]